MPRIIAGDHAANQLWRRALAEGDVTGPFSVSWNIAGDCLSPIDVHVEGEGCEQTLPPKPVKVIGRVHHIPADRLGPVYAKRARVPYRRWVKHFTDLQVRCRQCQNCLRHRQRLWAARVRTELTNYMAVGCRTWFGTLTLSPEQQFMALTTARAAWSTGGSDLEQHTDDASYFIERHKVISRWLTLYLKRVRKESGQRFRYLLVCEKHKSGLPHYHILIHEDGPLSHIGKRILQKQWIHGFSRWKLVEDMRQGTYLCKYLSKSPEARVRASRLYGNVHIDPHPVI